MRKARLEAVIGLGPHSVGLAEQAALKFVAAGPLLQFDLLHDLDPIGNHAPA